MKSRITLLSKAAAIVVALATILCGVGCDTADSSVSLSNRKMTFSSTTLRGSQVSTLEEGDKVGICAKYDDGGWFFGSNNDIYLTVKYSDDEGYYFEPSKTLYWPESGELQVYAYYPYDEDLSIEYLASYARLIYKPATLASNQVDFMTATSPLYTCSDGGMVSLDLTHQLSTLKFAFSSTYTSDKSVEVTNIVISNVEYYRGVYSSEYESFSWATSSYSTTEIQATSSEGWSIPTSDLDSDGAPLNDSYEILSTSDWAFMIPPQTITSNNTIKVYFTVDGTGYVRTGYGFSDDLTLSKGGSVVMVLTLDASQTEVTPDE